jgi:ketosteroid isomerase-like protein
LVDNFIGFEPNGKTSDKAGILAYVRSKDRLTSLKITALSVRVHGDTAIALGTEDHIAVGTTAVSHLRWLDTWKHTPDGWRLLSSAEIVPTP